MYRNKKTKKEGGLPCENRNAVGRRPISQGFTLIEIMVAVSIFVMVAMITTGTLIIISNANRKIEDIKQGIDNVSFSLNSMAIRIREGRWVSESQPPLSAGSYDCQPTFGPFLDFDGNQVSYSIDSTTRCLTRTLTVLGFPSVDSCLTAPNVLIDKLKFCPLLTSNTGEEVRYKIPVVISIGGTILGKDNSQTSVQLQTTVQMRNSF
jgi:prepilin-type N-terminal cleavage/methylation domain-containing protein